MNKEIADRILELVSKQSLSQSEIQELWNIHIKLFNIEPFGELDCLGCIIHLKLKLTKLVDQYNKHE